MTDLFPMPDCRVNQIMPGVSDRLHIAAHGTRPGGRCPDCRQASRAVHSRYGRKPADLPSLGHSMCIGLRVRRFYCRNPVCKRRTFSECLPCLVKPHARRTCRLAEAQERVGVALGGEAGARLLHHLAMPASADTVLRLIRRRPLPEQGALRVVDVDDWAMRRGRIYAPSWWIWNGDASLTCCRTAPPKPWRGGCSSAQGIEVVARDRSTEYACAAAIGAPEAVQVADRWHLLANVRDMLKRWLARAHARLRRLPVPSGGDGRQPGQRTSAYRRNATEEAASADSRARWVVAYDDVWRRHLAGKTWRPSSYSASVASCFTAWSPSTSL